jgi:hypothetical protein
MPKHPGGPFQPGHPRFGGRKRGSVSKRTQLARDIAAAMKFDPVKIAIRVIEEGVLRNKDGSLVPVPVEERLKMLRDLQQYIQPKLTAVQVTGKDEGPVNVQTVDIAAILRDPAAAQAAQSLAMAMALADADRPAIEPAVIDVAVEAAIDATSDEDD